MTIKNWSKRKKTIWIAAISVLLAGGVLAGVLLTPHGKPVEVVRVSQWTLGWMPDRLELYGNISSDRSQQVYYDKDQTILEVLVKPDDTVKIGDPLLRYDATLNTIDMELKKLELQKLEYDLVGYWKTYKKYAKKAYESTLPSPTPSPTPTPKPTKTPKSAAGPAPTGDTAGASSFSGGARPATVRLSLRPSGGMALRGSADAPDVTIENQTKFNADELVVYFGKAATAGSAYYVRVQLDEYEINMRFDPPKTTLVTDPINRLDKDSAAASGDGSKSDPYVFEEFAPSGVVRSIDRSFVSARIKDAGNGACYSILTNEDGTVQLTMNVVKTSTPTPTPDPSASPGPSDSPGPSESPGGPGGLTKEQREALIRETAKQIRDAELKYKQLRLDLQKLTLEGADGYIRATIDGVVSKVEDPETLSNGELMIAVKGSEGFYVRCIVDEMNLDKIKVGTELSGTCYDTGTTCTGRVTEVDTVPVTTNYYRGGNSNNSGYALRIYIEDGDQLQAGQYVEFRLQQDESAETALYLSQAFVREIDGVSYVFVARDGKLRQETVKPGKVMYGYVELVGTTLTEEDMIAFPYNKDVHDGAPVKTTKESDEAGVARGG